MKFKKEYTNKFKAETATSIVNYDIEVVRNQNGEFIYQDDEFESLEELTEYLKERGLPNRTKSQVQLIEKVIEELEAFFSYSQVDFFNQKSDVIYVFKDASNAIYYVKNEPLNVMNLNKIEVSYQRQGNYYHTSFFKEIHQTHFVNYKSFYDFLMSSQKLFSFYSY